MFYTEWPQEPGLGLDLHFCEGILQLQHMWYGLNEYKDVPRWQFVSWVAYAVPKPVRTVQQQQYFSKEKKNIGINLKYYSQHFK